MDSRWYSIDVIPSVYQGFVHCFHLLIRCYYCHSKIGESVHHNKNVSFPSLLWFILVGPNKADLKDDWLLTTIASHLDQYIDPWPFYTFYMILPIWLYLGTLYSITNLSHIRATSLMALLFIEQLKHLGPINCWWYQLVILGSLNIINLIKFSLLEF